MANHRINRLGRRRGLCPHNFRLALRFRVHVDQCGGRRHWHTNWPVVCLLRQLELDRGLARDHGLRAHVWVLHRSVNSILGQMILVLTCLEMDTRRRLC
jgi:hypothetical protein